MVDEPGNPGDVLELIKSALDVVWAGESESRWQDLISLMVGDRGDLRLWFRTEYFRLHIQQYSKKPRKAPIYWQLPKFKALFSLAVLPALNS